MANRVRELRQERGWNQRELAEATHVCQTTVSELERDVRRPWPKVAQQLSLALGASVSQVFPEDAERLVSMKRF
jgi:transcriptional regulator with XRE-family HTH domain